jgi:hypothetical protein
VVAEDQKINVAVKNAVLSFKAKKLEQMILKNQDEMKKVEDEGKDPTEFINKHIELKEISCFINNQLGRVITR